jgi:hypothetical protein
MPKMVLTAPNHGRERCERCNVTAEVSAIGRIVLVGLHHHRHCVPADVVTDAGLKLLIAWMCRL